MYSWVEHAQLKEIAKRDSVERSNIGRILCDVRDLDVEYLKVFANTIMNRPKILPLTLPMVSTLKRSYNIDYHVAADKFKAFASVKYVEEMVNASVPVLSNVQISQVHFDNSAKQYLFQVEATKEIDSSTDYIIVKSSDIQQEDPFTVYHGYCTFSSKKVYHFSVSHMDDQPCFKENDRITVFKKTDTREFEAWTRLARDIRQKEYLSRKVFVPDVQFDERREIFEPQLDQNRFNAQQRIAIKSMLNQDPRQLFVLFGPPGTGKTYTLIAAMEAIKKEFERRGETARFLICAHSNMAVDNFTLALLKAGIFEEGEIFRAYSSNQSHIPCLPEFKNIVRYSTETSKYYTPTSNTFKRQIKVVLSTFGHSYQLSEVFDNDFFTHIYVDEGGQAMDGEAMMPLFTFGNAKTVFVVAGDPKQLSATIISDTLENPEYNAKWSILDRLFICPEYANFRADQRCWVMLLHNYRSHRAITNLISHSFYQSELIATYPLNCNQYVEWQWQYLGENYYDPVVFIAVCGHEERIGHSYKNDAENQQVLEIITDIKSSYQVNDSEIGVVTPYCANVAALDSLMKTNGFIDVTVDSVEKFQGSERNVIIVSAVRTDGIGFLEDPKRLCTAISRPRRLLVIIGDPRNLVRDPNWKNVIQYLYQRNCTIPVKSDIFWQEVDLD